MAIEFTDLIITSLISAMIVLLVHAWINWIYQPRLRIVNWVYPKRGPYRWGAIWIKNDWYRTLSKLRIIGPAAEDAHGIVNIYKENELQYSHQVVWGLATENPVNCTLYPYDQLKLDVFLDIKGKFGLTAGIERVFTPQGVEERSSVYQITPGIYDIEILVTGKNFPPLRVGLKQIPLPEAFYNEKVQDYYKRR